MNYYRRFIPNRSTTQINRQTKKITLEAFNNAKTSLVNFTKLNCIKDDNKIKLTVTTDVTSTKFGAIVQEVSKGHTASMFFLCLIELINYVLYVFKRIIRSLFFN